MNIEPARYPERIEARSFSFEVPMAWLPASAAEFAPYAENDPSGLTEAVVLGPVDSDYQATCAIARGGWLYERTFRRDARKLMDSRANQERLRPWTDLQRTTVAGSPAYYQSFGYTARGPRPAAMTEVFVRRHDRDRDPKKDNIYWVEFGTSEGTHQIHLATLWQILRSWQWVGARRRGLFGLAETAKRDREAMEARVKQREASAAKPTPVGTISPEGDRYWDGERWQQAMLRSPDGTWWFRTPGGHWRWDGTQWQMVEGSRS